MASSKSIGELSPRIDMAQREAEPRAERDEIDVWTAQFELSPGSGPASAPMHGNSVLRML